MAHGVTAYEREQLVKLFEERIRDLMVDVRNGVVYHSAERVAEYMVRDVEEILGSW